MFESAFRPKNQRRVCNNSIVNMQITVCLHTRYMQTKGAPKGWGGGEGGGSHIGDVLNARPVVVVDAVVHIMMWGADKSVCAAVAAHGKFSGFFWSDKLMVFISRVLSVGKCYAPMHASLTVAPTERIWAGGRMGVGAGALRRCRCCIHLHL